MIGEADRDSVDDFRTMRKTPEWSYGTSSKEGSGVLGVELEQRQGNAGKEANWSKTSKQENFVNTKSQRS